VSWVIPPEARLIESYDDFGANQGGFQILRGKRDNCPRERQRQTEDRERLLAAQLPTGRRVRSPHLSSRRPKVARLIGPKKLTRFERARVVGARALQISMGAPVLIDVSRSSKSPIDIALMELEQGVLPISIRRTLPDGESQNIPLRVLLEGESRK